MLGSNEIDPVGWEVPVQKLEPILLGGVPRNTAILLGTLGGAFGFYITMWVLPGIIVLWVAMAIWAKDDPQGLDILKRYWHQKTHYYG